MRRLEELAVISVGRGVGFAALAIATFMIGLSADLLACLQAGGILSLITCFTLLLKALRAPRQHYKRTEVWIMMNPEERPHSAVAQDLIGETLRRTYLNFAMHAALVAGGLLFLSLMVQAAAVIR